jgi:hypothetical protein
MRKLNNIRIFVNEVENSIWEKPLQGSQIQDIHYSEDKTYYKVVALTYPWWSGCNLNSNLKPNTNASQPGLLPDGVFNGILYFRANP